MFSAIQVSRQRPRGDLHASKILQVTTSAARCITSLQEEGLVWETFTSAACFPTYLGSAFQRSNSIQVLPGLVLGKQKHILHAAEDQTHATSLL